MNDLLMTLPRKGLPSADRASQTSKGITSEMIGEQLQVHVANSNCWCNLWADQPYIRENMACALGLLQHNADEELWSACRDEHDECEPAQQGGSLMWIIALHRIQDRSEQALDHLKGEVARIDLSACQGEDVE